MNNKLSLISYILNHKNCELTDKCVEFIMNYEKILSFKMLEKYEIDGENIELTNYVLSYLNDEINDNEIYRLCLDLGVFLSNYSILKSKFNEIIGYNNCKYDIKSKILTNK